jgi:hypothetical protein
MDGTDLLVLLPDGTYAVLHRSMTWGEVVIALLLLAILVLKVYELWTRPRD